MAWMASFDTNAMIFVNFPYAKNSVAAKLMYTHLVVAKTAAFCLINSNLCNVQQLELVLVRQDWLARWYELILSKCTPHRTRARAMLFIFSFSFSRSISLHDISIESDMRSAYAQYSFLFFISSSVFFPLANRSSECEFVLVHFIIYNLGRWYKMFKRIVQLIFSLHFCVNDAEFKGHLHVKLNGTGRDRQMGKNWKIINDDGFLKHIGFVKWMITVKWNKRNSIFRSNQLFSLIHTHKIRIVAATQNVNTLKWNWRCWHSQYTE